MYRFNHFEVYDLVALSTFILLYDHHCHPEMCLSRENEEVKCCLNFFLVWWVVWLFFSPCLFQKVAWRWLMGILGIPKCLHALLSECFLNSHLPPLCHIPIFSTLILLIFLYRSITTWHMFVSFPTRMKDL